MSDQSGFFNNPFTRKIVDIGESAVDLIQDGVDEIGDGINYFVDSSVNIGKAIYGYFTGPDLGDLGDFGASEFDSEKGVLLNKSSNIEKIPVIYGARLVGGIRVFVGVSGTVNPNENLDIALLLSEGEIEDIDEIFVNGIKWDDAKFLSKISTPTISKGTTGQGAISLLLNSYTDWTTAHKLSGLAYLHLRFTWNADAFSTFPRITCEVRGKKVLDVRDSVVRYSSNPALCIYDYLTNSIYGKGLTSSEIDVQSFKDAADYCDTKMDARTSAPTGWLINQVGHGIGDTTTSIDTGTNNPAVGDTFTVPNDTTRYRVTSKIGIFLNYEPRANTAFANNAAMDFQIPFFEFNGRLNTANSVIDNLQLMLTSCRGFLPFTGGKYKLVIEKDETPTFTFNEDNITGAWSFSGGSKKSKLNRIKIRYINPVKKWQSDLVVKEDATYLSEDNGLLLENEISLPFETNPYRALYLAETALKKSRQGIVVTFNATLTALKVEIGEVIYITHTTPGWTNKKFRVVSIRLKMNGTLEFAVVEHEPTVYDRTIPAGIPTPPDTNLPDPSAIAAPTSLTLSSGTAQLLLMGDGTVVSRILASWTASDDIFVTGYEIEHKKNADSTFIPVSPSFGLAAVSTYVSPVQDGISYDVRVRAVNSLGVRSSWLTVSGHTVVGKTAAPSPPSTLAADGSVSGGIGLSWVNPSDADLLNVEVWEATTNDRSLASRIFQLSSDGVLIPKANGTIRYYWVRAVDTSGNVSTWEPAGATSGVQGTSGSASAAITTFYSASTSVPTATAIGDLWYQTDTLELHRWNGTDWNSIVSTTDAVWANITGISKPDDYATTGTDSNVLGDPNFYQQAAGDTDYWELTGTGGEKPTISATLGENSTAALVLDTTVNWVWANSRAFTATDGEVFEISGRYIYATTSGASTMDMRIVGFNAAGTNLGFVSFNPLVKSSWSDFKASLIFTGLSGGSDIAYAKLQIAKPGPNGVICKIDNVYLSRNAKGSTAVTTYVQTTAPTSGMVSGDIWFDSNDKNKQYRYSGTAWVIVRDTDIQQALNDAAASQAAADGKIESFYQTTAPTSGMVIGDIWVDTNDSNKTYQYSGSTWLVLQDTDIIAALTAGQDAQATANGRVTTFYSTSTPTANALGDLWYNTNTNELRRWNLSTWAVVATEQADLDSIRDATPGLELTQGNIRSGQTAFDTGTGFFLGFSSGAPKFSIGKSNGDKMTWDNSRLLITGLLEAGAVHSPVIYTSGSHAPNASSANAASLTIADTTDFASSGTNKAIVINSQNNLDVFTYTGKSTTTGEGNLTGIPTSGSNALLAHGAMAVIVPTQLSTDKSIVIDESNNEMYVIGNRGDGTVEMLCSIGQRLDGSDWVVGDFGSLSLSSARLALRARTGTGNAAAFWAEGIDSVAITATNTSSNGNRPTQDLRNLYSGALSLGAKALDVGSNNGIAVQVTSSSGYGVYGAGTLGKATVRLLPSGVTSAPTHSASKGSLWATSAGVLYINTNGSTTWQKVGAQ